jgi:hypothetical protein
MEPTETTWPWMMMSLSTNLDGAAPATFAQVFLKQTRSRAIVAGNNIGDRGTAALAAAVQTNPNLTALNLCSELCRT